MSPDTPSPASADMLSSFPLAWTVLALPFASAALIAHTRPLKRLSATHHRSTWTAGVVGLCAFLAGLAGLLPAAWTTVAVILGGAVSGFACFWPARPDDGGDDWRHWSLSPEDEPPPGLPDVPVNWQEFDRLRAGWERGPRVGR